MSNFGVEKGQITVDSMVFDAVSKKKIFFGHQSVGQNILDGINLLSITSAISKLNIVKADSADVFNEPVMAHQTIGENGEPYKKINEFKSAIEHGIGGKANIAMFKFCYLDVDRNTDVDSLFKSYKSTMAELKQKYPNTKFIHITVPLTQSENTLRGAIKKILGKQDNNINRSIYNAMLRNEYVGKEPIFDIAEIESTYPDGKRNFAIESGVEVFSLIPGYASDSGHLNEYGKKLAAKKYLELLAATE